MRNLKFPLTYTIELLKDISSSFNPDMVNLETAGWQSQSSSCLLQENFLNDVIHGFIVFNF